jgi:hypothetical protein
MNYEEWVTENIIHNKIPPKNILYLKSKEQLYDKLYVDTLNDILVEKQKLLSNTL